MPGNGSRRWQWSEHLWLPLLGATARASWQWPLAQRVFASAMVAPRLTVPAWLVLGLLLLPGLLALAVSGQRQGRAVQVLAGLLAVVGGGCAITASTPGQLLSQLAPIFGPWQALSRVPAAVPAIFLALLLWLEGSTVRWLRYADAWRNTAVGAMVLALLALLPATSPGAADTALPMAAFLVASLLSLALLSVRGTLATEEARLNRRLGVSRHWLAALLALVALLLLTGWAIASVTDPGLVQAVVGAMGAGVRWIGRHLAAGLTWAIYGLFRVLEPLVRWLRSLVAVSPDTSGMTAMAEQVRQMAAESTQGGNAPEWLQRLSTALGAIAVTALVVWLLLRAIRRPRPALAAAEEQRESIYSAALLSAQLRALLNRVRRRPRRGHYLALGGSAPADSIRLAYQRLLQALEQRQTPRQPGQTPTRVAALLAERLPAGAVAIATLTGAYVAARYGGAVDASTAREADQAAQTLVDLLSSRAASAEGRYADTG